MVIFNEENRAFSFQCDNGGNYYTLQVMGDIAFCVDGDGIMISQIEDLANGGDK